MSRKWFLDGEEVHWQKIIELAKSCGYDPTDGIFTTSEATVVLQDNGHKVECEEWRNIRI